MIKVLQVRETPDSKSDGIESNCQGLFQLIGKSNDIRMLPIQNYSRHVIRFLNQTYLDQKEMCTSVRENAPDIIHVHGSYSFTLPVVVSCAKKLHKHIALSPHFHPFWSLRRPLMGWLFFQLVTKHVLKNVDLVFTINDEDTAIMSRYNNNVVKVPHWSKFSAEINDSSKQKNMILFVGRIDESNKGFEHLYYLPEGKFEIHCVGEGNIRVRKDIIQHTNISEKELHDLYCSASLLVVPSRYEAFSYVALEALLCGTPVVMSDRVRIADHLKSKDYFSIFNYKNYDQFVETVYQTIGKPVDTNEVSKIFSAQKIKEIYIKEYLNICV